MKRFYYLILAVSFSLTAPAGYAFDATFYLVRHAEKQLDGTRDPELTTEGVKRAETIATMLAGVKFDGIYSTDFKRTQATARPTATSANLPVLSYDPRPGKLETFAQELKEKDGVFLIVGHSNTTPVVAGLLADQKLAELHEHQYDHIYVVTVSDRTGPNLTMLYSQPRTP